MADPNRNNISTQTGWWGTTHRGTRAPEWFPNHPQGKPWVASRVIRLDGGRKITMRRLLSGDFVVNEPLPPEEARARWHHEHESENAQAALEKVHKELANLPTSVADYRSSTWRRLGVLLEIIMDVATSSCGGYRLATDATEQVRESILGITRAFGEGAVHFSPKNRAQEETRIRACLLGSNAAFERFMAKATEPGRQIDAKPLSRKRKAV